MKRLLSALALGVVLAPAAALASGPGMCPLQRTVQPIERQYVPPVAARVAYQPRVQTACPCCGPQLQYRKVVKKKRPVVRERVVTRVVYRDRIVHVPTPVPVAVPTPVMVPAPPPPPPVVQAPCQGGCGVPTCAGECQNGSRRGVYIAQAPIQDPSCAAGPHTPPPPGPGAIRVRNPQTGACAWFVRGPQQY